MILPRFSLRRYGIASLSGLALLVLALSPAQANPDEARRAFEEGDYRAAATGYQDAYHETDDPQYLLPLGDAQRRLGNFERSLRSYRLYLERAEHNGSDRAKARRLVEQLERILRQRDLRAKTGPTKIPSQFNGANFVASEGKAEKQRPIGLYVSVSSLALTTVYTFMQVRQISQLEDQKNDAWDELQANDPESLFEIVGNAGNGNLVVKDACGEAKKLGPGSPSLEAFVSTCASGQKAARWATVGHIGMLASLAASAYFGYQYWGSSAESPGTVTPAVGPTGDGGIQGSVYVSF